MGAGVGSGGVWISPLLGAVFCIPDFMFPVLAQELPGPWPWGTVAFVMGSSPPGVSAASPAGRLGRAQKGHPLGTVFSSEIFSASWAWLSTRTQLCPSLSARTAMPSSTSATASSHLSCSESMFPRQAAGSLAQSRRPFPPLLGACRRPCEQGCVGTGQPRCLARQTLMNSSHWVCGEADRRAQGREGLVGGLGGKGSACTLSGHWAPCLSW